MAASLGSGRMTSRESERWDAQAATLRRRAGPRAARPTGARRLAEPPGPLLPPVPARVADLGCGTGTLSMLLAELGYAVDGVDFSPEMVRRATLKAGSFPGTSFWLGDAGDPPLPDGQYDVVLCRHVLWALPDPAAVLARWVAEAAARRAGWCWSRAWSTGAGLTAARAVDLVDGRRARRRTPRPRRPGVLGRARSPTSATRSSAGGADVCPTVDQKEHAP